MNLEIGDAIINYREDGTVESASFVPKMKIEVGETVLKQLEAVNHSTVAAIVKTNADLILGSFFSKLSEIELGDRDHYEVSSKTILCERYKPSGNIKQCVIRYTYKESAAQLN